MDSKPSLLKNVLLYIAATLVCVLYFVLRLSFVNTIEFGYDQPLLAIQVLEFLKSPTFINVYNFVAPNPWGSPSWGPAQIFFWSPFLLISRSPIVVSALAAMFNFIGIITIFLLGKKFFSTRVGIISALILAAHPWSIVFSRMIYQPTPVITLVILSMLLSFYILEKPKTKLIMAQVFLWAFIYQIYIHTVSFVAVSAAILLFNFKKISKKYFISGIILVAFLFLPVFSFFLKNPSETTGFLRVSNKFEELKQETPYSFKDITSEFLGTVGGGRFTWQLGYGYEDFIKLYPWVNSLEKVGYFLVAFITLYHLAKIYTEKGIRAQRLLLVLWLVCPILFLIAIKTPIALPRYFLLSLPAMSLLFALMVEEIAKKLKGLNFIVYLVPLLFVLAWVVFIFNYYSFVTNYKYEKGFLSHYSDVPYSFAKDSFEWIEKDALVKGYDSFSISSDFNYPKELRLNSTQRYYWENLLKDENKRGGNTGRYLMYFSPVNTNYLGEYEEFGPYVVYEYKD